MKLIVFFLFLILLKITLCVIFFNLKIFKLFPYIQHELMILFFKFLFSVEEFMKMFLLLYYMGRWFRHTVGRSVRHLFLFIILLSTFNFFITFYLLDYIFLLSNHNDIILNKFIHEFSIELICLFILD